VIEEIFLSEYAVEAVNLTKKFGEFTAVNDVSFTVPEMGRDYSQYQGSNKRTWKYV